MSTVIITITIVMMMGVAMVRSAILPGTVKEIDLLMPQVKPQVPDTYLCKSMKVEDAHRYITGFVPKADAMIAHHVLLYGCEEPGAPEGQVWNCGEMSSKTDNSQFEEAPVCKSGNRILYAWAMEAPRLILPPDVSFEVGQETPIKHLVVQVHYKNVSKFLVPHNGDDSSGLRLVTTRVPTTKQAGVYLVLTSGFIPAHTIEYFEAACDMTEDIEIVPFAYRTHAHALGRVISGYRVRDGQWTEIGRKDPRLPEMFYNTTSPGLTVKRGDILAARCTMENKLDHDVAIGSTQNDEMCNFYIMYYVNKAPILQDNSCFTRGPPAWYWRDFGDQSRINLAGIPDTVSVIPGSDKPLIRNATYGDQSEFVPGIPGRFEDVLSEQLMDQANPDDGLNNLYYLIQELAAEEAEEEERERLWQQELYRQQQMMGYPA